MMNARRTEERVEPENGAAPAAPSSARGTDLPRPRDPVLIAHRIASSAPMAIEPAPRDRRWLDDTRERFGYRCLPLLIANQAGWFILNPRSFAATWDGGEEKESLTIAYHDASAPHAAVSHFGHGILTWHIPYLFRTPPGVQLLARGPANWPKDGAYPLEGIVETDWTAATFTMNWKLLRPRRAVTFEAGEPICMAVPVALDLLEAVRPEVRPLESDPDLHARYREWSARRAMFLTDLNDPASAAAQAGWQKEYFRGVLPEGASAPSHRTKLKLRPFLDPDGVCVAYRAASPDPASGPH
jgi:hypothetical protein